MAMGRETGRQREVRQGRERVRLWLVEAVLPGIPIGMSHEAAAKEAVARAHAVMRALDSTPVPAAAVGEGGVECELVEIGGLGTPPSLADQIHAALAREVAPLPVMAFAGSVEADDYDAVPPGQGAVAGLGEKHLGHGDNVGHLDAGMCLAAGCQAPAVAHSRHCGYHGAGLPR